VADKEQVPPGKEKSDEISVSLGNEILNLLGQQTKNPSEAFILLQQLAIYLWDQYQIDWKDQPDQKVAPSRKQRYLDFMSDLIESLLANQAPNSPK
jgi:hypothetical protein